MAHFEEWRPAHGSTSYEVSSLGRVRSLTRENVASSRSGREYVRTLQGAIVQPRKHKNGYLTVRLYPENKTTLISRLVCEAFHGPAPTIDAEADHKNRIRDDNRADNLQWLTLKANRDRRDTARGSRHGLSKLTEGAVREIKSRLHGEDATLDEAVASEFGVSRKTISNIRRGVAWLHV